MHDTIRANLVYGLDREISAEELAEAARKARLYESLILKQPEGFETIVGDRGIKLSGGEKQRVSIARAFLKGAEILVLDEATSSLDVDTERLVQEAIEECLKGRTALVIAHRLATIEHADKVVVIENGEILEQGTPAELRAKRGRFYEYWQAQSFSETRPEPPRQPRSGPEEPAVERDAPGPDARSIPAGNRGRADV
jgi:ABC-type multidrug transport system fused ATPase/permease subunit